MALLAFVEDRDEAYDNLENDELSIFIVSFLSYSLLTLDGWSILPLVEDLRLKNFILMEI